MQACDLLIQLLGEQIHLILVCLCLLPVFEDIQLCRTWLVNEQDMTKEG